MGKYKLTKAEQSIIHELLLDYTILSEKLDKIESRINKISNLHRDLTKEYEIINEKILETRSVEYDFFKKMKEKYPKLKNIKELLD